MPRTIVSTEYGNLDMKMEANDWDAIIENARRVFKPGQINKIFKESTNKGTTVVRRAVSVSARRHKGDGKTPDGKGRKHMHQTIVRQRAKVSKYNNVYAKVGLTAPHSQLVEYGTYRQPHQSGSKAKGAQMVPGKGSKNWRGQPRKRLMTEFKRTGRDIIYYPHMRRNHSRPRYFFRNAVKRVERQTQKVMKSTAVHKIRIASAKGNHGGFGFYKRDLL